MTASSTEVWLASDQSAESANGRLATTTATHIVWLEASGQLTDDALVIIDSVLERFEVDLLYGDSLLTNDGSRVERPTFSPLRLREQDYLGPVIVMNVEWMRTVGGFDQLAAGIHGYDFALRFDGPTDRVVRVPLPLSRIRERRAETGGHLAAVRRRLAALGITAVVGERADGTRRVLYPPRDEPLVSVVIPTRGSAAEVHGVTVDLVVEAARGLVERTDYPLLEIVVVADDSTPQHVIDALRQVGGERLRLVRFSEPFNFSAKINRGAVYATGEYLLLLNDDIQVIEPDWLGHMIGLAQQPGVGVVGNLLLFEDGTVQHGGHLYRESWAGHIESPRETGTADPLDAFGVTREVSGVTAACALVNTDLFWRVGGMSLDFPGNYNDVDFCLKVRSTGASAVWTPDATLFHFESRTRDATILPQEIARLRDRWGTRLLVEQYWMNG